MSGCGAFDDDELLSEKQLPASSCSNTSCNGTSTTKTCSNANGCSTSTGCQQQQQQGSFGSWARRQAATSTAAPAEEQQQQQQPGSLGTCMKCKAAPAVALIRQHEPYCNACIEAGVIAKFRYATKGQGLIATGDSVLLAVSGGAASMALLWCTIAMQSAHSSRPERGKVPFRLAVLHVDCSAAWGVPAEQAQQRLQQLQAAAAAAGFAEQLLVLQLHDVFADQAQLLQLLQDQQQQQQQQQPGVEQLQVQLQAAHLSVAEQQGTSQQQQQQQWRQQWQQQLQELLGAVSDTTGREDLAAHLQDSLLLRAAAALGCSRMLRGECACRTAANIIAEAAKGRGFSVPADIQLLDARLLQQGGPAVLRPLREVTLKELAALCTYKGIAWSDRQMGQPRQGGSGSAGRGSSAHGAASVNQLADRFIADMQGSVPASIYTILRTASHLQPFGFNALAAVPGAAEMQSSAARQSAKKQQQQQPQAQAQPEGGGQQQWLLCSVCRAPLPASAAAAAAAAEDSGAVADAAARDRLLLAGLTGAHSRQLCYTCNRQLLYKVEVQPEASSAADTSLDARMQRLRQLLPPGMLLEDD
uniref:Cytoplasmic tRNA 2-thiolation protein 2 n=1 Tax=Tetradesmus obliquus TaxID=3088 RepID=A0A383WGI9_TETOB|eukprot:jgi/Sobl393_1/11343/SZX76332.1